LEFKTLLLNKLLQAFGPWYPVDLLFLYVAGHFGVQIAKCVQARD